MPTKNTSRARNRKLTDFFIQTPPASVPALATSASPTGLTTTTRGRLAMRASKTAINCASSTTTRKRARSPDSTNPSTSLLPPTKLKATSKPSGSEHPKTVIYVTSTLSSHSSLARRPTSPVQVHSNTLLTSPLGSSKQVVYSSQSDEAELVLPIAEPRDLGKVVEGVNTWRRKAFESSNFSPPRIPEDAMVVDLLSPSPVRSSPSADAWNASPPSDTAVRSAATSRSNTAPQTPTTDFACLPSPSDTNEFPPLPLTPEPINPEAKTAKLIAEVKARAFAANQCSDDEPPLAFRELEDSEDDDLIDELPLISSKAERSTLLPAQQTRRDIFSSPLSSVPSNFAMFLGSSPLRPTRTPARARKPAAAFRLPVTIVDSSTPASATISRPSNGKKSRLANPLHALLREKESQDRRGTGTTAFRLAEEAAGQGSCGASANSDDEPMNQSHLADEQAAWKAVYACRTSTSPVDPSHVEVTVGDRESKMLGIVAGEAINKILTGDKDSKGRENVQNQKTTQGVPLWTRPSDEDMEVDSMSISPLSGHPVLTCLDGFLGRTDGSLLDMVLRTGTLAVVPRGILLSNMPQLLSLTLFSSSQVADAVYIALRDLWVPNPHIVQMPLTAILSALVQLGANPSVLEGLGSVTERAQKNRVDHETFLKALKRLLSIIKAAGCVGAFASDDVANVLLSLVIMGLDPLTSGDVATQLNVTMDAICNHSATDFLLHDVHGKVLNFASQLAPINKARLVSLFASGSGRTRRIARDLAYCLLVSVPVIPNPQAPPLEPLILLLSPDAGSRGLFDITSESTDYEDLKHYINILSVALVDIAPYIEEERATVRSRSSTSAQGSPSKCKKPRAPPLELLRGALEVLQSKIVDTRAAHLDRSRTKEAIQRLTMRINYDRIALMGTRQASTLKTYFSPQRT